MNSAFIEFGNNRLAEKTRSILDGLPLFDQEDYFAADLRESLVAELELGQQDWQEFLGACWLRIRRYGYVLIRNLPLDDNNRLSVALASALGSPIPHNQRVPTLVRRITPRSGDAPLEDRPHTDSPHWTSPNDMITLECEREDQHLDVFSRIALLEDVEAEIRKLDPGVYQRLFEDSYPFILIPEEGDGGYQMQPVMTRINEGGKRRNHIRFCLSDSIDCIDKFGLDNRYLDDLYVVEKAAADIGARNQFVLKRGDWLVFDNKRTFHSKTRTSVDSVRVLRKMKLNIDRARIYA